jgi:tetratricopeptide (TPR) repeat protein
VRENRVNFLSIFIIVLAFLNPGRLSENLVWSLGLIVFVQVLFRLHHVVLWLTFRGNFDLALYANRLYMHIPGHGDSGEGWILSMAGRYAQALAFYKPQAFDENGKPLLTSLALYMYASNLLNNDDKTAAQVLFEAAVGAPDQGKELSAYFRLGLADSLLYQGKDAERARDLTARVIADEEVENPSALQRAKTTRVAVFYAYAVASCGKREEAISLLRKSMADFQGLNKHDLAACEHMRGFGLFLKFGEPSQALFKQETGQKIGVSIWRLTADDHEAVLFGSR